MIDNRKGRWKIWREQNPEKAKASAILAGRKYYHTKRKPKRLMELYGLTAESWNELFISQDSKCAICKSDTPDGRGWAVDHDHNTGVVRGILCHKCNVGIGHLKDDINTVSRALDYLSNNHNYDKYAGNCQWL